MDLESLLADWHKCRYGLRPVDIKATLIKAGEEFGELCRAVLKDDHANAREEAADVAIVLTHLVRGMGGSLADEMWKKLKVIFRRLEDGR